MERRFLGSSQKSVSVIARADGKPTIAGYAAVFHRDGDPGTEFELWPGLKERIDPGAFTRAVREDDVRSAFNHDPNMLLGRKASGTLRLSIDDAGLRYEVDPPDSRADVVEAVRRGDVSGSSFSFEVLAQEFRKDGDGELRILKEVRLHELGPVVFPAYESTTTAVRATCDADALRAEVEKFRASRAAARLTPHLAAVRARAVKISEEIA